MSHRFAPCVDATISTVIIEDAFNNELYRKLDFCSGSAATNYRTLFGTSSSPVASMSQCVTYTIKINCTSTGWDDATASLGVWADFNDDKDFSDPGEWLSDASWTNGVVNGINGVRPSGTRSLTFSVPGDAASSFVIRIRSSTPWVSK